MHGDIRRISSGSIGQLPTQPSLKLPEGRFGRHSISATTAELKPTAPKDGPTGTGPLQHTASLSNLTKVAVSDPSLMRLPGPKPQQAAPLPPLPPPPAPTLQASQAALQAMSAIPPAFQDRERVVDGQGLKALMGRDPKKNAKLFGSVGPRVWDRSGTYKGVLKSLDRYQNQIASVTMSRNGAQRAQQVQTLTRLLDKVDRSIGERLGKKDEQPMRELRAMVQHERALLQSLADGRDLPAAASTSFQSALDLRHVGMPPDARADLQTYNEGAERNPPGRTPIGSGQVNTVFRVEYAGDPVPKAFKSVASQDLNPASMATIAGIDRNAPSYAARNVAASMLNEELGLDVIPRTSFAKNGDEYGIAMDLVENGRAPGGLAQQGQPLDAASHRKISAEQAKVDAGTKDPATFKTEMGLLGFKIDAASGEWRFHPTNGSQANLDHPVIQNKLNDLEWSDIIGGQIDRNTTNFLITYDNNGQPTGVKGIDNDYSFGTKHPNPDSTSMTGLPKLIDSDTADSIERMGQNWNQPGGMKEKLSALFKPEEIGAMESRLFGGTNAKGVAFKGVIQHIADLRTANMVVPHGQWDTWRAPDGRTAYELVTNNGQAKFMSLSNRIISEVRADAVEQAKW